MFLTVVFAINDHRCREFGWVNFAHDVRNITRTRKVTVLFLLVKIENKFKRMKFVMTLIKLTVFVEALTYIPTKKTQCCLFELIKQFGQAQRRTTRV